MKEVLFMCTNARKLKNEVREDIQLVDEICQCVSFSYVIPELSPVSLKIPGLKLGFLPLSSLPDSYFASFYDMRTMPFKFGNASH